MNEGHTGGRSNKEADRILVLHITDAEVLGSRTWTPTADRRPPTAEERAYLDEETSTAAGRIRLAHMCREYGGIQGVVEVCINKPTHTDLPTALGA